MPAGGAEAFGLHGAAAFGNFGVYGDGSVDIEGPAGQLAILCAAGELATLYDPGGLQAFQVLATREIRLGSGNLLRVSANGYLYLLNTSAPASADLANSSVQFWFDPTPAATKLMFRGKDAAGTVKSGSVALV